MRIGRSFTLDLEVSNYVDETRGEQSASDRVNELLRRAMIQEQYERLEAEAAKFFASKRRSCRNSGIPEGFPSHVWHGLMPTPMWYPKRDEVYVVQFDKPRL